MVPSDQPSEANCALTTDCVTDQMVVGFYEVSAP